jgi:hypothetical protein
MSAARLMEISAASSSRLLADVDVHQHEPEDRVPALDRLAEVLGRDFADRLVAALSKEALDRLEASLSRDFADRLAEVLAHERGKAV